ncbi:hypothetical protein [Brevundimonas sp.]|uniref:hypothetical protein n=1 Tax=Brevundimonas sp. TaxID=1871086 RepID=UPI0025C1CEED|nr:hypothetical protein [Brevundimonas sp.]
MTLVLTAMCPIYVVQVSDRLVTVGPAPHDVMSNKTIVYRARDALVSIGYSGVAYVGDVPMDDWIAGTLWGGPIPRGPDGKRPAKSFGPAPVLRDIGQAAAHLEHAIKGLASAAVDKHGLYLTLAGWQGQRHGARPIVMEIERREGVTTVRRSPRRPAKGQEFRLHSIGARLSTEAFRARFASLRGEGGLNCTIEEVETRFAETIRETAMCVPSVGENLLSVVLPRPDLGPATCRFLPARPHAVRIRTATRDMVMDVAHSPWIVGPSVLYPPSAEIGETVMDLGGVPLVIVGAAPTSGLLGLSSSIRRPLPPSAGRPGRF